LDIIDENQTTNALINLLNNIFSTSKGHVTTGIIGTKFMMEVLRILEAIESSKDCEQAE
jgi:hypothetical protein